MKENDVFQFPESVDWPDVPQFFNAWLAARQTQAEHARALVDLWHEVWRELPLPWQPVAPDAGDDDLSLDPAKRWEEGDFTRRFEQSRRNLQVNMWAVLGVNDISLEDVSIKFNMSRDKVSLICDGEIQGWIWDPKWESLQFDYIATGQNYLDLGKRRSEAGKAIELIASKV